MVTQYKFIKDILSNMKGTSLEVSYNHYIDNLEAFNELTNLLSENHAFCNDRYYKGVLDEVIYYLPKEYLNNQDPVDLVSPFPRFNGDLGPIKYLNYHRVNVSLKFTKDELFVNLRPFIFGEFTIVKFVDTLDKESFHKLIKLMSDNFSEYKILVSFDMLESDEKPMIGKLTFSKFFSLSRNLTKVYENGLKELVINSNESIILTF